MPEEILKLGGTAYHPSAANTGNEAPTALRGRNAWLRGSEGSYYFESFKGIKNLNESIPMVQMSGTVAYTDGSVEVVGTGTAFKGLRFGQKILTGDPLQVFVVDRAVDDTHLIVQRPADATATGQAAYKPAHLFPIDDKRGTQIWGNALKWDRGNITAVGEGRLRINGDVLPGESLTATGRLQIALFDPNTQQYDIGRMGFDDAPLASLLSIAVVSGGTRNMTIGRYSFRYSWANSKTGYGFSNPSDAIKLDASSNVLAITATNQRFQLDFTAALPTRPANADALIIFRSRFQSEAENLQVAAEGSWFAAKTIKIADLEAGDIVYIDVLDGELGTEVTFDNDPPPNADWISSLAGDPILIACYGDTVVGGSELGESPGPYVSPSRRGNRDGYPAALATTISPPETIIGFAPALGRLFLMTKVGLPFAVSTGQSDFPVETRAFWTTRFKSPYGLVFFNDAFYAFTIAGATKAIGTADKAQEQTTFAAAVEDVTRHWYAGYVHATYDPQNEAIVLIYSAAYRNEEGFWVSLALPFSLRHNCWMPEMEITKPGRDMIVTGAATIGSHLQFLAGGRGNIEVVESEESEEGGPDPNQLNDLLFCCGFECGYLEYSDLGGHHQCGQVPWEGTINQFSINESVVRTGRYSMKVNAQYNGWSGFTSDIGRITGFVSDDQEDDGIADLVGRFYIYFETLPASDSWLWSARIDAAQLGVFYKQSDGKIYAAGYAGSAPVPGASGVAITTGNWIRIDLHCVQIEGARTMDVQVNGTPCGQYADAAMYGASVNNFWWRISEITAGVWYIDDCIWSESPLDYPIGPGQVFGRLPSYDGAHNVNTPGRFTRGSGGANIINSTTTAHQVLDDRPMKDVADTASYNTSDAIVAVAGGASDEYVEIGFDAIVGDDEPTLGPRAVDLLVLSHRLTTSPDAQFRAEIDDNGTQAQVYDDAESIPNVNGENLPFMVRRGFINPPSAAAAWTTEAGDGDIRDVRLRLSSGDPTYDHYFDAAMIECEYSLESD